VRVRPHVSGARKISLLVWRVASLIAVGVVIAGCGGGAPTSTSSSAAATTSSAGSSTPATLSAVQACVNEWNGRAGSMKFLIHQWATDNQGNPTDVYASAGFSSDYPTLCLITISNPDLGGESEQFLQQTNGSFRLNGGVVNVSELPASVTQWNATANPQGNLAVGPPGTASSSASSTASAASSTATTASSAGETSTQGATTAPLTNNGPGAAPVLPVGAPTDSGIGQCANGVYLGYHTSCPFAEQVYSAIAGAYNSKGFVPGHVTAYSSATRRRYELTCVIEANDPSIGCGIPDGAEVTMPYPPK
jgi:hypothetical protein